MQICIEMYGNLRSFKPRDGLHCEAKEAVTFYDTNTLKLSYHTIQEDTPTLNGQQSRKSQITF